MKSASHWQRLLAGCEARQSDLNEPLERFRAEAQFAVGMLQNHPELAAEGEPLLEQAVAHLREGLAAGRGDTQALVEEAERLLAPLCAAAKQYTVYCAGHGHIDMNWMWTWPETVACTLDTFSTVDRLMDEFPQFHYSQSQASVYHAMQQYAPEVFERIRARIAEGRWEVTASQWVEGDKNLASGEILCRHLLYTRRWLHEHLGLPYDAVKVDWEPDTFGHCATLPGILRRGGVSRYYHHRASAERWRAARTGEISRLFWWEGRDGSRVLTYDDSPHGYNCEITPALGQALLDWERGTGWQDMLWVYGVGDHGGGPTRRHLRAAVEMQSWPLWPTLKLTTTDEFFTAVESKLEGLELPVVRGELNYVFEGCYSSQSRIKFANRAAENALVEAEAAALLASRVAGFEYPAAQLGEAWRHAMFNQFHDILPGSGVRETREYTLGLLQEILALTNTVTTRSLRAVAAQVNTSALAPAGLEGADAGLGGGAGAGAWWGGVTSWSAGPAGAEPLVVFNPAPFARDEVVLAKLWDRPLPEGGIVVRDAQGRGVAGQVVERGDYWGHQYATVAFSVRGLPGLGYRSYLVQEGEPPAQVSCYVREAGRPVYSLGYVGAQFTEPLVLGNEYLEVTVCGASGGIISLLDKASGTELVPDGAVLGSLEREQEAPHGMSSWMLGAITDSAEVMRGSVLTLQAGGPPVGWGPDGEVTDPPPGRSLAAAELRNRHGDSEYRLTISLTAGSRRVDFRLKVNWLERGDSATGVPVLRASHPLAILDGQARFEIPCGYLERPADGEESPALAWADLTGENPWTLEGEPLGAALLTDSRYAYRVSDDCLRLTLLRSSYEPDPLPELGEHEIRWALLPHCGPIEAGALTRAGYAFNHAAVPVSATLHDGPLPPEAEGVEVLSPNVMLSGLKRAEDSGAAILRLYEIEGLPTQAQVRLEAPLAPPGAPVVETDLLEQPLSASSARLQDGVLTVELPPYGLVTVRIGA